MPLDAAYLKAVEALKAANPYIISAKSGADFENGDFRIRFFNRTFIISHHDIRTLEVGVDKPVSQRIELLLYHYLLTADGSAIADEWITYRQLPGAFLFEERFGAQATSRLLRAFDKNLDAFRRAGEALGGTPMTRTGDAGFRFMALPRLPVGCVIYLGDEEVPGSAVILFDKSAPHYLATEDLSILGHYLINTLISFV